MAPSTKRVPAWQRLGLTLTGNPPSGQGAPGRPDIDTVQSGERIASAGQHAQQPSALGRGRDEEAHASAGPTQSGKPSATAKRKHPPTAAAGDDQAQEKKRLRKSGDRHGRDAAANGTAHGAAGHGSHVRPPDHIGGEHAVSATKAQPKGDPNYRKKKSHRNNTSFAPAKTDRQVSPPLATPQRLSQQASLSHGHNGPKRNLEASPPPSDRPKSVTFTPDTKLSDGNSASNLFKHWVAEQKSAGGVVAAEPRELTPSQEAFDIAPVKAKAGTKKKDPSVYLSYLSQYHNHRANWKFNKAKQNDIIDNALNIFRIPEDHSDALVEYIQGLKGAAVIERLKARCSTTIKDLDEEQEKDPMDDQETRKIAKDEALAERLVKEHKRRRTDADVENLTAHPYPDGYIRRLKRQRAHALLSALSLTVPAAHSPEVNTEAPESPIPPRRNSQKRKVRANFSSDDSSSSSDVSSDEESSSEDSSSESDSDSNSESGSGSSSEGDEESDSASTPGSKLERGSRKDTKLNGRN